MKSVSNSLGSRTLAVSLGLLAVLLLFARPARGVSFIDDFEDGVAMEWISARATSSWNWWQSKLRLASETGLTAAIVPPEVVLLNKRS